MSTNNERSELRSCFSRFRESNRLAVAIVYATLMLDNMLLTAVVPILPEYFFLEEKETNASIAVPSNGETSTPTLNSMWNSSLQAGTVAGNSTEVQKIGCEESRAQRALGSENFYLAFLIASKPLVQVIANAAVGPLTDKFGYDIPMSVGYIVLFFSSLIFAFGKQYGVLMFARAFQGIGSACAATAGMGMLADRFRDDTERGQMIGIALGGLAMGVLVGPPFASITYQFSNKETPFIVLAVASLIIGVLQIATRQFKIRRGVHEQLKTSLPKLLKDPYILLAAATLMLGNMAIGIIETGQPIWMMTTMCAEKWMLGIAFLPESVSYLISTLVFGSLSHHCGRWIICLISFYISAVACITLPLCKSLYELIGPGFVIGTAVGMVDSTIFPIMGQLVDTRHTPVYGSVYAIADVAFCTAFIVGPLLAGTVIRTLGFIWLMTIIAIVDFVFAPFVYILRNPPAKLEEATAILHATGNDTEFPSYDAQLSKIGRGIDVNTTE